MADEWDEWGLKNLAHSIRVNPKAVAVALELRADGYSLDNFFAFEEPLNRVMHALGTNLWGARDAMFAVRKKGGLSHLPHGEWRKPKPVPNEVARFVLALNPSKHRDSKIEDIERVFRKFRKKYALGFLLYCWTSVGKQGRVGVR